MKSWLPTRKWLASAVPQVGGWLIAAAQNSWHIGTSLQITAIGIGIALAGSYLLPNANQQGT